MGNNNKSIKIGRTEYQIQKGDYILYNGSCYQFVAADKRTLKREGWSRCTHLIIPQTALKKINFTQLKKVVKNDGIGGMELTYFYF